MTWQKSAVSDLDAPSSARSHQILAGFHAVGARLRNDPSSIEVLYFDANRQDGRMRQILSRAQAAAVRCVAVNADRLQGLSPEASHQGLVAQVCVRPGGHSLDELLNEVSPRTLLLLLDGVTDPRNLGACLRTAAAAAVDAVIVPRDRSASLTAVASKAAAGAAEAVPLIAVTNLARAMKQMQEAGIWITGADMQAQKSLYDVDLTGARAWVLGAEGSGLRRLTREHCDTLVQIPMAGSVESLNVSVAAGVCLFETLRQRQHQQSA